MERMFFLIIFLCMNAQTLIAQRICAKSYETGGTLGFEDLTFSLEENQLVDRINKDREVCKKGTNKCYTFWKKGSSNENITWVSGGCWETSGQADCASSLCQPQLHPKKKSVNLMFCCCTGNLCNANISFNEPIQEKVVEQSLSLNHKSSPSYSNEKDWKVVILGGCGGVLFILFLTLTCFVWRSSNKKKIVQQTNHQLQNTQNVNNFSFTQLSLEKIIGQGRYGTVWLGYLKDQPVAVKMFPVHYSQYFYNEKDIYSLPFMEHPSLLKYLGSDEFSGKDDGKSLAIALSYCPLGSLQEYLKTNVLDLATFIKITLSLTSALAHLHTEIKNQDNWKPCITHRDVNTKNILVKDDLSCCLADLGLAVKITGSHYYTLGEEQHAETKSINDVGTLRYMAPEVLEGAVNLRDCESSLKQVDVYALGLVLWEVSMRVSDFYTNPNEIPPYVLPFEKEVGLHPTFEEMQNLVCRNKARPLFPREWKNNVVTATMRETIEDCTDQDGEARLTAFCVHERISQLQKGSSFVRNASPTFNPTNSSLTIPHNNNNVKYDGNEIIDKEMTDGCASEGTVETIVTLSPSEPYPYQSIAKEPIHAYQGRNPCWERNLLSCGSKEEICIVQTSNKHKNDQIECDESVALVPGRNNCQPAIPFVQNKPFTVPKLLNVPTAPTGIVASLMKFIRKKEEDDKESLTNVIVSPFEERPPQRPSSLQLISPPNVEEEVEEEKRLKELGTRIRTPGDLPASVRKKRGAQARLSLYDDRMMSNSIFDSSF